MFKSKNMVFKIMILLFCLFLTTIMIIFIKIIKPKELPVIFSHAKYVINRPVLKPQFKVINTTN